MSGFIRYYYYQYYKNSVSVNDLKSQYVSNSQSLTGVAFLSNNNVSYNPNWSSKSSPSPPIQRNRSPSPSPRFSSSLFKLIRHSVRKNKKTEIEVSLEAETTLRVIDIKPYKPLKRVASQPVTVTRPSTTLTSTNSVRDSHPILLSRSPNLNEDNSLVSSSPPLATLPISPIPCTAPIMTPLKSGSPTKTSHLAVFGRRLSESDLSVTPKGLQSVISLFIEINLFLILNF